MVWIGNQILGCHVANIYKDLCLKSKRHGTKDYGVIALNA